MIITSLISSFMDVKFQHGGYSLADGFRVRVKALGFRVRFGATVGLGFTSSRGKMKG